MLTSSAARSLVSRGVAISSSPIKRAWAANVNFNVHAHVHIHVRAKTTTTTTTASTMPRATTGSLLLPAGTKLQQSASHAPRAAYFSANAPSSSSPEAPAFSIYEYPTRTEAPEITTTRAADAAATTAATDPRGEAARAPSKLYSPRPEHDPFDDAGQLTPDERRQARETQEAQLGSLTLSSLPITRAVPSFIPPNVPSKDLTVPETLTTTLPNGIRVVSQETYSQMCTIGVLTNVGSRHEDIPGTVSRRDFAERETERERES